MMRKTEFLIVGQGIAGSLLAHELIKKGRGVLIVDEGHQTASSAAAAGIVNPITGRRFILKSDFNRLKAKALETYLELETLLGIDLLGELSIVRQLFKKDQLNRLTENMSDPDFRAHIGDADLYVEELKTLGVIGKFLHISSAFRLNIHELITEYRLFLKAKELLIEEAFDYDLVEYGSSLISYKNIEAEKIIFCEGARIVSNPWFKFIPIQASKGQAMIIELPYERLPFMFKGGVFIVPLKDPYTYWVGTADQWEFKHPFPDGDLEEKLIEKLNSFIKCHWKLLRSVAAIRPGIKDRMPVVGKHPESDRILVFNGLGTKGSSLGPYWAAHFADYLCGSIHKLDKEVNVNRFLHLYDK